MEGIFVFLPLMKRGQHMKEIFDFLNYTIPIRRNVRTKVRFLTYLNNEFEKLGFKCKMWKVKNGMFTMYNLVVGNLASSENIILVGYDTPIKTIQHNYLYYPLDANKNKANEKKNIYLQSALSILVIISCFAGAYYISRINIKYKLILTILLAITGLISALSIKGIPNGNNLNKNTAAVTITMKLLYDTDIDKTKFAVVFLDRTADGYFGYKKIKDILGEKLNRKNIIILDCLAYGTHNYLITNCDKSEITEKLKKENTFIIKTLRKNDDYSSVVSIFNRVFYMFCADELGGELVVKNTRSKNDRYYMLENMERIEEALKSCFN